VVNKADRAGAHGLMAELTFAVHLQYTGPTAARDIDWETPVLAAEAPSGTGVADVLAAIRRHREILERAGVLEERRRARRRLEFETLLVEEFRTAMEHRMRAGDLAATSAQVAAGTLDPYSAAEDVLRRAGLLTGS
jgi:LAO/AO transport system kinase